VFRALNTKDGKLMAVKEILLDPSSESKVSFLELFS
jgi:hypothetical protein